jgi:uncharacterized Zn finger protein (UPF0148 family)
VFKTCPECGGKLVLAPTLEEGIYEVVCTVCGLVVDVTDRERYASEEDPENPLFKYDKVVFCRICKQQISWNGKGRKPKYCKQCAKEVTRLNKLKWKHHRAWVEKNSRSKNDIYLLAIKKRAS